MKTNEKRKYVRRLTSRNYFSKSNQLKYMGVSQFKAFEKCEYGALAEIKGKYKCEQTVSMLVGSYVDAHFEGTLDIFKAKNPQIFKKNGELLSQYAHADEIIARIERDKLFTKYMSGEKQVIMTGEIEGVPVKIKVDSLHPDKIVDLKIMKDFAPIYKEGQGRLLWFEAWGYDLQGAVYQEIVYQNTGKKLPFYLAAATKESVPDIDIIEISQDALDFELNRFKEKITYYDAIKKGFIKPHRCEKCDACKFTKVLTEARKSEDLADEQC